MHNELKKHAWKKAYAKIEFFPPSFIAHCVILQKTKSYPGWWTIAEI